MSVLELHTAAMMIGGMARADVIVSTVAQMAMVDKNYGANVEALALPAAKWADPNLQRKEIKMAGCNKEMEVWIERGFSGKEITVKCGSTSPTGYPWLCEKCEEIHAGTDWRREAMMNGENFDDDY